MLSTIKKQINNISVVKDEHRNIAKKISKMLLKRIKQEKELFIITLAGELGKDNSEIGKALIDEFLKNRIASALLNYDDLSSLSLNTDGINNTENSKYFMFYSEGSQNLLQINLRKIIAQENSFNDYCKTIYGGEKTIKIVIIQGAYASLLKNVDCKIFITQNKPDTLIHKREDKIGTHFNEGIFHSWSNYINNCNYILIKKIIKEHKLKGDIILVEKQHRDVAKIITKEILTDVINKPKRYIITVAGESGSGKSETGKAITDELIKKKINSVILGQDDYFVLPPKSNDEKRRKDSEWLGPHVEVRLDLMQQNIQNAINGKDNFVKPLIDYDQNIIHEETINLNNVKVIIAEGTYTSLLKNIDCKIFIAKNRLDTLEHRQKRNRGSEIGDTFIEGILETEHKIIAGHKYLSDFIITKTYEVIRNK